MGTKEAAAGSAGPDARGGGPGEVLWLAIALGCAVGLGEAGGVAWRALLLDRVTRITPHVVWMAPVGYSVLFLVLGAPIAFLVRRPCLRIRVASTVFLTLGLAGWLAMLPWELHPMAVWILAAGAAWAAADALASHPVARRVTRVGAVALGLLVVLAAAISLVRGSRAERAALDAMPSAPEGPNVLLVILDTVRAKSLGLYGGSPEVSPWLDRFGGEAIVFERAHSTAPWTLPAHASMFTGRWPHELSAGWDRPLDDTEPTLSEVLAARGYATAGFVGNLLYTSRPLGLARGFARYEDYPVSAGQLALSMSLVRQISTADPIRHLIGEHELLNRKTAADINDSFLDWLDSAPERPYFVFLNYFDAHEPYEPPPDLRAERAPSYRRSNVAHRHDLLRGVSARRIDKWAMPPEDLPRELALYEASITGLDRRLAELFDALERRGRLANTHVIITSDHGEQMGEHGMFGHLQSLYTPLTHVPLVIRPAGAYEPGRIERAVSLRDLPATVLDLVDRPGPALPGASLATLWEEDREPRASLAVSELHRGLAEQPWYPIASGLQMQSLLSGTLYYICNPDGTEELYDLASDPGETVNLAGTPTGDQAVLAFRAAIAPIGAPPRWCPPPPDEAPRPPERSR